MRAVEQCVLRSGDLMHVLSDIVREEILMLAKKSVKMHSVEFRTIIHPIHVYVQDNIV